MLNKKCELLPKPVLYRLISTTVLHIWTEAEQGVLCYVYTSDCLYKY